MAVLHGILALGLGCNGLQLVEDLGRPQVVFSEGIVGPGRVLFEEVCRQGLEGLVAKRLASRYRPGRRTEAARRRGRTPRPGPI